MNESVTIGGVDAALLAVASRRLRQRKDAVNRVE